jgi:dsDNA-specific endonuclease/ATPase MutS2
MDDRISRFSEAKRLVEKAGNERTSAISKCLSRIHGLKRWGDKRQVKGRIVLTDSEEILKELEKKHVSRYCAVRHISKDEAPLEEERSFSEERGEDEYGGREGGIIELARAYDVLIFIPSGTSYPSVIDNIDNVELIKKDWTIDQIVPETIIDFFSANLDLIKAICELSEIFKALPDERATREFKSTLDFEGLHQVTSLLGSITEKGETVGDAYPELNRLRKAIKSFNSVINDAESWVNDEIKKRVGESSVTIRGEQVINILMAARDDAIPPEELNRYLPSEVVQVVTTTLTKGEQSIVSKLGLKGDEESLVEGIIPRKVALPIEVDRRRTKDLEDLLRREYMISEYRELRNLASKLVKYTGAVEKALQTFLEFDLFFAVGQFAKDYHLTPPKLASDRMGTGFKNGVNLFLKEEEFEKHLEAKPINYIVGNVPLDIQLKGAKGERVVLLSGANSGGKTCCIQTIAHIVIMGQMGLPVPAEDAYIGVFDEIHYFSKSKGVADAGAFETTLRSFAKVILSQKKKMILVDELESITEPGAAAKVIGGVLEKLSENPNTCAVFVSHLAEEISKVVKTAIRIDGIEAKGLDQNLNLVVDRNPILSHLAKSMPQLIITRLKELSKGEERETYEHILEKFR